ncbi:MAG: amino acid permease [Gammaproteobacteria bacterium]|nr:amino acid permease [Gammaproteobacteria bacterium]NNK97661.1 amino acid permease [Xanthomonadales bacterium]
MKSTDGHLKPEPHLERAISKLGYTAITLNGVIGAGIFGLPAVAAAKAGAFSPWLFVIAGLLILSVVLSFARAASLFRDTGGMVLYADRAFGPFMGFQAGWLAYIGRVTAMGANANLLVTYASWFWTPLATEPYSSIAISTLILGLTWLNVSGVKNAIGFIYLFTALKLLPISLLVLFGAGQIDLQMLAGAGFPPMGEVGEAVLVVLYAYVGFEGTVVAAGEGRRPRRDLPWALINTILITGLVYILVQMVSVSVLPGLAASSTALADVAVVLFGAAGAVLLTLGAVFSIGGNLSSTFLSAPRMTFALARDGSLPGWFARVHDSHHTPHVSLWFYGAFCLLLALTGSFVWLAVMSTLARLLTYMICIAALPRLEKSCEPMEGRFRLPGGLLIPAIAMLLCLWLVSYASLAAWLTTLGFVLLGSLLYASVRWRRKN